MIHQLAEIHNLLIADTIFLTGIFIAVVIIALTRF